MCCREYMVADMYTACVCVCVCVCVMTEKASVVLHRVYGDRYLDCVCVCCYRAS